MRCDARLLGLSMMCDRAVASGVCVSVSGDGQRVLLITRSGPTAAVQAQAASCPLHSAGQRSLVSAVGWGSWLALSERLAVRVGMQLRDHRWPRPDQHRHRCSPRQLHLFGAPSRMFSLAPTAIFQTFPLVFEDRVCADRQRGCVTQVAADNAADQTRTSDKFSHWGNHAGHPPRPQPRESPCYLTTCYAIPSLRMGA